LLPPAGNPGGAYDGDSFKMWQAILFINTLNSSDLRIPKIIKIDRFLAELFIENRNV